MTLPQLKHPGYTVAEWAQWEGRWELIHGEAYDMTPAPAIAHQRAAREVCVKVVAALEEARKRSGGSCEAFFAPTDVHLGADTVVQPDLLIVCDPAKISDRGIEGAPDLVVEVLSPSTASKDLTTKRWLYESAGVKEYLVLDPGQELALLFLLEDGRYREALRVTHQGSMALMGGALDVPLPWPA